MMCCCSPQPSCRSLWVLTRPQRERTECANINPALLQPYVQPASLMARPYLGKIHAATSSTCIQSSTKKPTTAETRVRGWRWHSSMFTFFAHSFSYAQLCSPAAGMHSSSMQHMHVGAHLPAKLHTPAHQGCLGRNTPTAKQRCRLLRRG